MTMTYYVILGSVYAAYVLGVMHGKKHEHWANVVMALAIGALWPVAVLYGIYLQHFARAKGE
ncbi:hypothetical protein [Thiobacillus denitrificans]|uniref:hypothetical protein n=1 Tax=Thiobacillus denitrificans TaxID=36861 RepID=UPI000376EE9C|nr:hypothetical protein [Thiobacillus denitrificans]